MFYHVRINQKSQKNSGEYKLDLSEERLQSQFLTPYENGEPIIINGKTILPNDIDRIRISESEVDSSKILPIIKAENDRSNVVVIGGPPDEWYVADKGKDITDELIQGPPGYKKDTSVKEDRTIKNSKKVFIVHGHDIALKNDLEIFLKNLDLEPIVLHRQPDEGLTILEKLEKHSDVAFAFILLTPDDIGSSVEDYNKEDRNKNIEFRARQNVIFEFGFLAGKLGRTRVCCIYKEGVALPTDLSGFLYKKINISIDDIGFLLIKELKAAGFNVKI